MATTTITATERGLAKQHRIRDRATLIADEVRRELGDRIGHVEHLLVLTFDGRRRHRATHLVEIGSQRSCPVNLDLICAAVALSGARQVAIAHNHPSGDATPSVEDHQVTARLEARLALAGVDLLDHVVVAATSDRSFAYDGYLRGRNACQREARIEAERAVAIATLATAAGA